MRKFTVTYKVYGINGYVSESETVVASNEREAVSNVHYMLGCKMKDVVVEEDEEV